MEIVDTERGQVLLFALAAVQYGGNWDFIEYARGNSRLKLGGQGGGIGSSEVFRDVDPPPPFRVLEQGSCSRSKSKGSYFCREPIRECEFISPGMFCIAKRDEQ
jgi:hypothetical protein